MSRFAPGEVYAYHYLWAEQDAAGEESGRKVRPSCVVFRSARASAEIFLFPITTSSRPPLTGEASRYRRPSGGAAGLTGAHG